MNIGALVAYKNKAAVVTAVTKDKIEIRCAGGESRSVREKDVELIHPGPVATPEFPPLPEPDWAEVTELAEDALLPFADFAELAYGAFTPAAAWHAWNALGSGIWFTGSVAGGVRAQDPARREELLRKNSEKEDKKRKQQELLERIRNNALQPEDRKYLKQVEAVGNGESDTCALMHELGIAPEPAKAHALLRRLGIWDDLYDPWPPRLGVNIASPEADPGTAPEEPREDLTDLTAYAIDDAGSSDPDDAVAFRDGVLYVHVADPASSVTPGSAADEEASWRGESSYLPELLSPMLREEAVERFGLGLRETSPALTFALRIGDDGAPHLEKILLSTVHVERHTYESAASSLMETPEFIAMREALGRFRDFRAKAGALFIRLPEVKTRLRNGEITITPAPLTPERELVANAMLAAGAAVAAFMKEQDVSFPFVTQAPPEIDPAEFPDTLPGMFRLKRSCSAGLTGTTPGKHAGLGLEPYSRVTSPLRRYADLLAHQQIRRFLKKEELLDPEYLDRRLARAEEAGVQRRKLEKYANEYYLLHYLERHPEWQGTGTVVEKDGERLSILIPEFAYCYKCRLRSNYREGDEVALKFTAADPVELRLRLQVGTVQEPESSGL